jgi:hypothetical protein
MSKKPARLSLSFEAEVSPGCPDCKKRTNFDELWQEYFTADPDQALATFTQTGKVEFYLPSIGTDVCAKVKFLPRTARVRRVRT